MHAKVIILDETLSHITDVCLFVKEKDSIFFQKIPEKVSLSGEQKKSFQYIWNKIMHLNYMVYYHWCLNNC